ncbi:hypothetical protein CRYUN_Cryun33cG0102600 [Craigia yunnanensis]
MLEAGLVKKLVQLQRLENQCNGNENGTINEEGAKSDPKIESDEGGYLGDCPFESCVVRVREASVSEAESATIVVEVLWGSSP